MPSRRLRRRAMLAKVMLGEPILIGRDTAGAPFALRDPCPHRGMPLSAGRFDGREVECCYHGWRFDTGGQCTSIPSLVPGQTFSPARIRVRSYPVREVQGNIWVFFGDDPAAAPEIPLLDGFGERLPNLVESVSFAAAIDHAVVGLMDPAHGPFVHRAWWWRSRRSIQQKSKVFAPSPYGFTMSRHIPSANSRAYRLLGGTPETEIVFRLPSVRIEQIQAGRSSGRQFDRDHSGPCQGDRDQPLHLLDLTLAHRAKAGFAPLRSCLSASGPHDHGAPAARSALRPAADLDRRRRHPGEMVLPLEARISPLSCRGPTVREPDRAAYPRMAQLKSGRLSIRRVELEVAVAVDRFDLDLALLALPGHP